MSSYYSLTKSSFITSSPGTNELPRVTQILMLTSFLSHHASPTVFGLQTDLQMKLASWAEMVGSELRATFPLH